MAKSSGGAGRSGQTGSRSVISDGPSITIRNERSRSGGGQWKYTTLEASAGDTGELSLSYPRGKLEQINRNTTVATYNVKAAIYNQMGSRSYKSHNINWDNISRVTGQTYDIRGYLKDKGFRYDGSAWVK